jgi:hypothetical protein
MQVRRVISGNKFGVPDGLSKPDERVAVSEYPYATTSCT